MQLVNLDNEVYFKKVFTDPEVFRAFVLDITGVDMPDAKIETEKELERKVDLPAEASAKAGAIRFKLDIYAESADKRVLVEIQRIDYDYNFNRFLHYFLAALLDLQRSSTDYSFAQDVYTIVVLTAPYVVKDKTGRLLKDDVLVSDLNPRTLNDLVRDVYPHRLIFLNPNHIGADTPDNFRDWLQFISESIHNPRHPAINLSKPGIQKAADLANVEDMPLTVMEDAKKAEAAKKTKSIYEDKAREEGVAEGIEKGAEQKEREAVIGFHSNGVSVPLIAASLNISEERVLQIY